MTRVSAPWVVEIAKLLGRSGTRVDFAVSAPVADAGITDAAVAEDTEVTAEFVLESIGESVTVAGTLAGALQANCRRCLEEFRTEFLVPVKEIFEATPEEGETYKLGQDELDLEPMVREVLLLELPMAPLCREGCEGPVPEVFEADTVLGEAAPETDPRWAALDGLASGSAVAEEA